MRPNSLRQKLDANEITVCTRIFNPCTTWTTSVARPSYTASVR